MSFVDKKTSASGQQSAVSEPHTLEDNAIPPHDDGNFGGTPTNQVIYALLHRIRELETPASFAPAQELSPTTGSTDIVQFLRTLVSHLVLIVVVGLVGLLVTYVLVNSQTSIFQTDISLVVIPNIDESAIPRPIQQIEVALGTYVQVLRSQNLNHQIETKLSQTYDKAKIEEIETEVRPVENSSIIAVTVQSSDPALAQAYALAMIDTVRTDNPLPLFEMSYRLDVLDTPDLPTQPIFPNKKVSLVLGGIGSLILGVVLAFFVETYITQRRRAAAK